MKASEIRHMNLVEIENQLLNLEEELFNLRFQKATRQVGDPNRIKSVRRDIARLKTVIHEHELDIHALDGSEEAEAAVAEPAGQDEPDEGEQI